jgi:pimeloyl-ACP methyl ester carboxylesterase
MMAAGQVVHFRADGHDATGLVPRPTVLLLHGTANSSAIWEPVRKRLSERGFDAVAVDMPGHGQSTSRGLRMRVYTLAGVLDAFVRKYSTGPVVVVGHSLGSVIGMELAYQAQDRVAGLLLLNGPPVPVMNLYSHPWRTLRSDRRPVAQLLVICLTGLPGARWVVNAASRPGKFGRSRTKPPLQGRESVETAAGVDWGLRDLGRGRIVATALGGFGYDYEASYRTLRQPIKSILGADDRSVSPTDVIEFFGRILPHAQVEVWENIGHAPMLECIDETAKAIEHFVDEIP